MKKKKAAESAVVYSYQQWLDIFTYLHSNPADSSELERLKGCTTVINSRSLLDSFLVRLDDVVKDIITYRFSTYFKQLDALLEETDYDGAQILSLRFESDMQSCFFFRSLDFLPKEQIDNISEGYSKQINAFWQQIINELREQAQDSCNFDLEEFTYQLARIDLCAGKDAV